MYYEKDLSPEGEGDDWKRSVGRRYTGGPAAPVVPPENIYSNHPYIASLPDGGLKRVDVQRLTSEGEDWCRDRMESDHEYCKAAFGHRKKEPKLKFGLRQSPGFAAKVKLLEETFANLIATGLKPINKNSRATRETADVIALRLRYPQVEFKNVDGSLAPMRDKHGPVKSWAVDTDPEAIEWLQEVDATPIAVYPTGRWIVDIGPPLPLFRAKCDLPPSDGLPAFDKVVAFKNPRLQAWYLDLQTKARQRL